MVGKKPCIKCLLAELDHDDTARSLLEYIRNVPEDKRVDQGTYSMRLEICRDCESLVSGMCRECGCYAELRALKPGSECPAVPPKWQKL